MTADVRLGPRGVWAGLDHLAGDAVLDFARRTEAAGFGCLWVQEGTGREPFALLGRLVGATTRLRLGVGIASIFARDATAARAGARTLAELSGGRFVMGLGVSHRSSVTARGHRHEAPLTALSRYLDAWEAAAPYRAPLPDAEPLLVLAALRRRALELAATRSDGAFPYLVTPEYLRRARRIVDDAADRAGRTQRPLLIVTQAAAEGDDRAAARQAAVKYLTGHLRQPNYQANLLEMGFSEAEFQDPFSDRLIESLVALGDPSEAQARAAEMEAAGADHVALIPLGREGERGDREALEALAPPV